MSPGAVIAIGCWAVFMLALVWAMCRAAAIGDQIANRQIADKLARRQEAERQFDRDLAALLAGSWDDPHERRHTGGVE